MLRNLLNSLPATWGARILPDHESQLELESVISLPITVTNLVVELTLFLLALSPYLELMDRAGISVVDPSRKRTSMSS
jgi:hypothetical protein